MIILDTHILVWSILQPEKLTDFTKEKISIAQENDELIISSISLWEIAMLQVKKRIKVFVPIKDFLDSIVSISGLGVVDISSDIAAESVLLADNFQGDPADRIIVATSRIYNATLITQDQSILSWASNGCIKI